MTIFLAHIILTAHTCRTCYDTLPPLAAFQMGHFVVCAAQLEAEDGLQILPLEQDIAAQPRGQIDGMGKRSFGDDFVDTRSEDESQVLLAESEAIARSELGSGSWYIWVAIWKQEIIRDCLLGFLSGIFRRR